jgi:hypothetical protein
MNFTLNNKYFKGSSPLFWIGGLAALVIGVVLLFVQDMLAFGILIIVASLVYLGVYFGSRAKDSDITDGLNIRLEQLRNEARADFDSRFAKTKKISNPKIYEFARFLYEPKEPGGMLKTRLSSFGEIFTSRYAMTLFYIDEQNRLMNLYRFTLSLIEDDDEMDITTLPYTGLAKAWLAEREIQVQVGNDTLTRTNVDFCLALKDGTEITFPCVRDASTETLVEDVNIRYCKETQEV